MLGGGSLSSKSPFVVHSVHCISSSLSRHWRRGRRVAFGAGTAKRKRASIESQAKQGRWKIDLLLIRSHRNIYKTEMPNMKSRLSILAVAATLVVFVEFAKLVSKEVKSISGPGYWIHVTLSGMYTCIEGLGNRKFASSKASSIPSLSLASPDRYPRNLHVFMRMK